MRRKWIYQLIGKDKVADVDEKLSQFTRWCSERGYIENTCGQGTEIYIPVQRSTMLKNVQAIG